MTLKLSLFLAGVLIGAVGAAALITNQKLHEPIWKLGQWWLGPVDV